MLLTRRKAIKELFERTGRRWSFCVGQIDALPKQRDGKRLKIRRDSLDMLVRVLNARPLNTGAPIKPLSETHKQHIRAAVITKRAIQKLVSGSRNT